MHGNASSRLEAGCLVAKLLERNISLFCFDWAGCGQSDGEYISLGWHERDDLASVIDYLRESPFNGPIALWGRSMGAVTALMHVHRDSSLAAMVVDSPFKSLRVLIEELAQSDRLLLPVRRGW
jgi:alpha/beta superfamily hydrolase